MSTRPLPFRQVHLDFHTSPACTDVGAQFDAAAFVATLQAARVSSINIFAKCHHGYAYYPTEVGTTHPNLSFDLLGAQLQALRGAGILAPVYVSLLWDDLAGQLHPDWIAVDKSGRLQTRATFSGEWGWSTMDVDSGYGAYFLAQVEEICDLYAPDGLWVDICYPEPNYSPWGIEQMRAAGIDPEDDTAVLRYARQKMLTFFERTSRLVKRKLPQATICYNNTINRDMRETLPYQTHFELESLPTAGEWGYLHFPLMARQARTYGKPFVGMNGRFHTMWGDFGGLKTRDQLDYEGGTILGAGGSVCVGDQLHPNGVLDPAVYRLIGSHFAKIEALEPWLAEARPTAEAALLTVGPLAEENLGIGGQCPDVEGAAQLFLELGIQFDLIDAQADMSPYGLILLAGGAQLDEALRAKIEAYMAGGGRLILSGTAALDPQTGQFQLACVPVTYRGLAPTVPSYIRPDEALAADSELADDYDYVFYDQAHLVSADAGAISFGDLHAALFNRTWEHYISHQHAPAGETLRSPAAVRTAQVLYLAAPLFSAYRNHNYWAYRVMLRNLLAGFLPPRLLEVKAPGWVEMTLHEQPVDGERPARQIVHVVRFQPRRSWQPIQHVDQAAAAAGLSLAVRRAAAPGQVYLAPDRRPLTYTWKDGAVQIELPPLADPHVVVVIE